MARLGLFAELKRRNVLRVATGYAVLCWLILQIADVLLNALELQSGYSKFIVVLLLLGAIPVLVFSWVYELTPEGLKKEADIPRPDSITPHTARKLDLAVIVLLVASVSVLLLDRLVLKPAQITAYTQAATASQPQRPVVDVQPSIAVLPFVDMSADGDQEYFADGISEELLNVLVRVDGLSVASRTSSFAYKGLHKNLPAIARELNVGHILEGSVRKSRNRVRITAQLIETASDRHLWSETYDRDLDDIFAIQEEIASAILQQLKTALKIESIDSTIKVAAATENLTAYDLYLQGHELFIKRQHFERAITALETAVQLDPGFARAWEQLGATYAVVESWGLTGRPFGKLALKAADQALKLDPALSMPHAVRAQVSGTDVFDWETSFKHLDRAIQADSNNATAYLWRAINYLQLGFFDKADADIQRCLQIDPAYGNCRKREALIALLTGDEQRAVDLFMATEIDGNYSIPDRFFPALVHTGHRYAVFAQLKNSLDRLELNNTPPYALMMDAWGGAALRDDQLAQLNDFIRNDEVMKLTGLSFLLALHLYERIPVLPPYGANLWQHELLDPAAHIHFKRLATGLKAPQYWRKHGFPPQCRPLGDDDFECGVYQP